MDTLYEILIEMSSMHKRVKINGVVSGYSNSIVFDLSKKDIKCGNNYIMKDGTLLTEKIHVNALEYNIKDICLIDYDPKFFYEDVEILYKKYIKSVPTKYDIKHNNNFIGKVSDELTFIEIIKGENRCISRCKLEAYILLMSLSFEIEWENNNNFFWKSNKFCDLILFREWIKNVEEING